MYEGDPTEELAFEALEKVPSLYRDVVLRYSVSVTLRQGSKI